MIKAIAFDYGGVIELKNGDLVQEIADSLHVTKEDWHNVYFSFNHLSNTEKISNEEVVKMVAKKLNASELQISFILDLIKKYDKKRILNLELIEIIKDLKKKNYKIGLLSNNSIALRQKLAKQNIIDLFNAIIISSEVGYQKPWPEFFDILFSKLNLKADEVLFVDDTPKSLENAHIIGYTPVLYTNNEKLKSDLLNILGVKPTP